MDAQTLADWIGHDAPDYDLDAAAEALTGIDLDTDPERTMTILAEHERTTPDQVAVTGKGLLALALAGGGEWGGPVPIVVADHAKRSGASTSIKVTLAGESRHLWIADDGTGPDVPAVHAAWEDACSAWEADERDLAADLTRAHAEVQRTKAVYDAAVAARRGQVKRWVGSGRSMYAAAKLLGVAQSMVQRMAKG